MTNFPLAIVGHEPGDVTIVDPATGEAIAAADATTEQIGSWRRAVMDFEDQAKIAKRTVDEVVLSRMDRDALWTVYAGGLKLSAPSPSPSTEYPNPEGLRDDLDDLPDLSPEAIARTVVAEISYKVTADGIKRLRALNRPDVDAVIDAHAVTSEKTRRVTVKTA